jgi:two-component system chemotaxis sensor kinase CheA
MRGAAPGAPPLSMTDRSQKALSEFVSEAQETIDALAKGMMRLAAAGPEPEPELLNSVFRAAHSLKGLASMFGVERLTRLAHALEDALDDLRMGRRAIDAGALDLLLEAPEVFSRIISEESEGTAPATQDAAARLTERLRAAEREAATPGEDPLDAVAIGPEVRRLLTEYEEHRLRASVRKGLGLYRVRVAFELASFDAELAALSARLKELGEVVSTLPSSDMKDPGTIAFELLLATSAPRANVVLEAGPHAAVEPVTMAGQAPSTVPARAPSPWPVPVPASPAAEAPPSPAPAPGPALVLSPTPEPLAEVEVGTLRSASQAVRVDIRKLDRLMNVVGELVLVKSSLQGLAERFKGDGIDPGLAAELRQVSRGLERRLAELQGGILEVRMVPLDQIFDKLTRMVRKLGREVGKEIELEVSGGEVELDKLIVEDLSDPLMHLVRNAVDHAIEQPEVRARKGKPRAGRITLAAVQRGHHVQITVSDDGNGIDEDRIREVAVARGLASASSVVGLSRREVMNLIFVPGFSTARQVTSLSGRGVGMDVVKNNIAALSGIIDLQSERGVGTRFEITMPVTLAIIRALVVKASGRTYAVPLNSVLEILEVRGAEIRTVATRELITLRGASLPLVRLARFFAAGERPPPEPLFVVVVGLAQERLGLAVDELLGQQDIVVKPLGNMLAGVRGIAGATDLGQRTTVLVLDVGAIIEDVVSGEAVAGAAG